MENYPIYNMKGRKNILIIFLIIKIAFNLLSVNQIIISAIQRMTIQDEIWPPIKLSENKLLCLKKGGPQVATKHQRLWYLLWQWVSDLPVSWVWVSSAPFRWYYGAAWAPPPSRSDLSFELRTFPSLSSRSECHPVRERHIWSHYFNNSSCRTVR